MIFWSVVALLTKRTGLSKETRKKSAPIHKVWTVSLKNYVVFFFWVIPEVIERNVHRKAEQGPSPGHWRKKGSTSTTDSGSTRHDRTRFHGDLKNNEVWEFFVTFYLEKAYLEDSIRLILGKCNNTYFNVCG